MNTISITIREYCTLSGYSVRNATKHLNNGTLMPYMRNIRKSGSTWLIDVDKNWYDSKHCDVCGSTKLVECPAMGINCENCHPLKNECLPNGMVCRHTYQVYKDDGNFYCSVCGTKTGNEIF